MTEEAKRYNRCLYAIAYIEEKIEQIEARLQKCEESYNTLQERINANNKALEKECEDMLNRPTVLVSKLAELGFKGTWTREDPIYNSNISDKPIGSYTETINTDNSEKRKYYWFRGNKNKKKNY